MVNELKQVSLRDDSNDKDEENKNSQATPSKNSKPENSVQETTMDATDSDCNRAEMSIAGGSDTVTGDEGSEITTMSCGIIGSQGVESDGLELPMEVVSNGDSAGVSQPVDSSAMKETDLSSHGVTMEGPGRTIGGGRRMSSGRKAKE